MVMPPSCRQATYPYEALKKEVTGISLVGLLIRPDGTVARPILVSYRLSLLLG